MAIDKCALIHARIFAVLSSVTGIIGKYRNRDQVPPDDQFPAVFMLDGRERRRSAQTRKGTERRPPPPGEYEILPQIFVVLKPRTGPENEGVGEELELYRRRVLAALVSDDQLWALLGSDSGDIIYLGFETDQQTGSTSNMEGQMLLELAFIYILDLSDLL